MKSFFKNVVKGRAKDAGAQAGVPHEPDATSPASDPHGEQLEDVNEIVEQILSMQRSAQLRRHFLSIPASEYTSTREVRIWVGSFNTASMPPRPDTNVHSWIHYAENMWPERLEGEWDEWTGPDLVIAGFQEINALNASNMLLLQSDAGTETVAAWDAALDCVLNRKAPEALERAQAALQGLDAFSGAAPHPEEGSALDNAFGVEGPREKGAFVCDPEAYTQICSRLLVGIYVSVWARKSIAAHISGVQTSEVKTGAGGYLGNKGAVMARMRVYDTPLCAIVAHLSSGEAVADNLRRAADFAMIERFGVFSAAETAAAKSAPEAQPPHTRVGAWTRSPVAVEQPNVICAGDLNFRLTMEHDEVRACLKTRSYERLLARDQLLKEMEVNPAFRRWKEGIIAFPPTFKYVKGSNLYIGDTLDTAGDDAAYERETNASRAALEEGEAAEAADTAEAIVPARAPPGGSEPGGAPAEVKSKAKAEKTRTPAWTDRILWKSDQKCMHLISYARAEINLSDHKPVMAALLLSAEQVDRAKVADAIEASRRACDMRANQALPRCSLSERELFVGRVAYGETSSCSVLLKNEGEVAASFFFLPLMAAKLAGDDVSADAAPIAPSWLRIHPAHSVVAVGGTVTITFTAAVAASQAQDPLICERLMQPGARMDAILVLRIEDGSDHFLPISGTYAPSFFGLSLSTLAGLPRPLNARDGAEGSSVVGDFEEPGPLSMSGPEFSAAAGAPFDPTFWNAMPWELRMLLRHLTRDECLRAEGIFSDSYQLVQAALAVNARGAAAQQPQGEREAELSSVVAVRRALDAGEDIPATAGPHDVAATLLSFFKALPQPFIPAQISQICQLSVPPAATAAALLKESMKKTDWAALCCILNVMKLVLRPEQSLHNKHTPHSLAKCLAEHWFPPVNLQELEGNSDVIDADRLQKMLEMASDISERRASFLQMFLQPGFGQR